MWLTLLDTILKHLKDQELSCTNSSLLKTKASSNVEFFNLPKNDKGYPPKWSISLSNACYYYKSIPFENMKKRHQISNNPVHTWVKKLAIVITRVIYFSLNVAAQHQHYLLAYLWCHPAFTIPLLLRKRAVEMPVIVGALRRRNDAVAVALVSHTSSVVVVVVVVVRGRRRN